MQCSWFASGYIFGVSLWVLLKEFLAFLRDGEPGSRGRFSFRLEISISTSPLYLAVTSRNAHASSLRILLEEFDFFVKVQRSIRPA